MSPVRAKGKHLISQLGAVGGKEMFSKSPGEEQMKLPGWPGRLPQGGCGKWPLGLLG